MKNLIEKDCYNKSGIYKIVNIVNNKIYIGSAYNLYSRFRIHKSMLLNDKHDNDHLQKSYNKYGSINFTFELIEIVYNIDEIYEIEKKYIEKFYGTNCYNMNTETKFSEQVSKWNESRKKEFSLISPDGELRTFKGYTDASREIGISSDGIRLVVIGKSKSHKGWRLPENKDYDYKNFRKVKNKGAKLHNIKLLSPDGEIIGPIYNIDEFSRKHNINSSMISNIIAKRTRYCNGWSLYEGSIEKPISKNAKIYHVNLTSPDGELIYIIENLTKFCKERELNISCIRALLNGRIKKRNYNGWIIKLD